MTNLKIAVQEDLHELTDLLKSNGYNVVKVKESGLDADVSIIDDVDMEYEEMQPIEIVGEGEKQMVVINASHVTNDEILRYLKEKL